jgi:hypothetical protein
VFRCSGELRGRDRNPILLGRVRVGGYTRLRTLHVAVVHEKGTGRPHRHLVQFQRMGTGTARALSLTYPLTAQIFGGLVAYGIAVGCRKTGTSIEPWKIVFLVTGLLTTCIGVVFLWIMPDNQLNCRWLSKEDRILALERIRMNNQGVGNTHFKMYQLKEALLDPLSWAFFFYALTADIPNGGISNFFSQLIVSFGYTPEESLLYGTPGGAVEVVFLLVCGWAGDKYGYRILISMTGLCTAILGMVLIVALPLGNSKGRLAGYYLTQASPTPFVALLSLISSNVAGYTKKTTVAAMYLIGYCAGNIIGVWIASSSSSELIVQDRKPSAPKTRRATYQLRLRLLFAGVCVWAYWRSSTCTACCRTRRRRRPEQLRSI